MGIIFNTRRVICCSVVDGALGGVVVCCVDAISPAEDKRLQCAAIKLSLFMVYSGKNLLTLQK
jgi:hypothetical protein